MKKSLTLVVIIGALFSSCQSPQQNQQCPEPPLVPKFLSQAVFAGKDAGPHAAEFASDLKEGLIIPLIEAVQEGNVAAYDPLSPPWEEEYFYRLNKAEIDRKFSFVDTMYIESPEPPYDLKMVVTQGSDETERMVSLRAYETWHIDDSLRLRKEVSAYTIVSENIDHVTGQVRGWEPIITLKSTTPDDTRKKLTTIRYSQGIENLDTDEWYRFNLEYSVRERFFEDLLTAASDNALPFYASPDATSPLSDLELKHRTMLVDTVYIESPAPPYDLQMTVVEEGPYWGDITEIEFVQDVYIDDNFNLSYEVRWYAPRRKLTNRMTGKVLGIETLFWVKCS